MSIQRFVIVTGVSGAGKSQAMKSLEDVGFYCLDNLPPALLPHIVALSERTGIPRVAIALDVRTGGPFGDALETLDELARGGHPAELLFLDASDEALVRRYSETRRRHPFAGSGALTESIERERSALGDLRRRAQHVWDTSGLTHGMLKERIADAFGDEEQTKRMRVLVMAFGFKHGIPMEADLVFDVRFLPNPNYVPELKPLTGADRAVEEFLETIVQTAPFLEHLYGFIDFLMPQYVLEGKSQLTIAVGCTGGRHRSVYIARRLRDHLTANASLAVSLETRDIPH